MKRRKTNVNIM